MNSSYKDHYRMLGISPRSSDAEIKNAFRRMSMKYHPDMNDNSELSNRIYKVILNAYKILSDGKKRAEYDNFLQNSSFIRRFGRTARVLPDGGMSLSSGEILQKISITLWEIDDLISADRINKQNRKYFLKILTFLDRWVLEPCGFPDYFMEARSLARIDPREYIRLLDEKTLHGAHLPYSSFRDYYYDIRKRTDRFLTKYSSGVFPESSPGEDGFLDRVIEYNNMALYYLGYLLEGEINIPDYDFSKAEYRYSY